MKDKFYIHYHSVEGGWHVNEGYDNEEYYARQKAAELITNNTADTVMVMKCVGTVRRSAEWDEPKVVSG